MAGKARVNNADVEAANEIYNVAREQADQEIAELKAQAQGLHEFAVMAGRVQAFSAMQLLNEFLAWKQIAQMADRKEYLLLSGVKSLEDYFEMMGIKPRTGFNNLKIARNLEVEELQLLQRIGFTRRDLLGYASLPEEKRLEIKEGKVINLESASREDIRDLIEQVIVETKTAKEETAAELKAKDRVLKAKEDVIKKQEKDLARFEKQARAKNLTPEEDALLSKIEELSVSLEGYALTVENVYDALRENPFPNAVAAFIALADNIKMRVSHFRETAVTELAPAGMLPEEEWVPPPLRKETAEPRSADCLACREEAGCDKPCCKECKSRCQNEMFCRLDA